MEENRIYERNKVIPFASPLMIWALSVGTSIGWGSFVVTSNAYLQKAGPVGSVIGTILGALVMFVIGRCYFYMMNVYPDNGGIYAFAKNSLGYDFGYLSAWFTALTYLAIFWANVTSLPLFAKYFFGDVFRFGLSYTIFDYQVYFGEAMLAVVAIIITTYICMNSKKTIMSILTIMSLIFTGGITICFVAAMIGMGKTSYTFEPAFVPDKNSIEQILRVALISPWAFIGFENISHFTEEFNFPIKKSKSIIRYSIIITTILYIFVLLLSVSAYPQNYGSWLEYINDLSNIEGIEGLPAFYCANYYLGKTGVYILMLSLLALILTSLIGNTIALSRLFHALGKDKVLPSFVSELNENNIPANATFLVGGVSILIPFLGRTAIGWIVDVTTIGAVIIYGLCCASAYRTAKNRKDKAEREYGRAGMILMIIFAGFLLVPSLFSSNIMASESCFLFSIWAALGFLYFRAILKTDTERRFGHSVAVWIVLLSLIMFTSTVWMSDHLISSADKTIYEVREHYQNSSAADDAFMEQMEKQLDSAKRNSIFLVVGMFALSLGILLNNYHIMENRARESEEKLGIVRSQANTDPLTGVKSKRAYIEKEKELNEKIKDECVENFAIAICDVNNMKYINDTYGHKEGDEYIKKVSKIICKTFKHSPVFRFGGDEFVILLTGEDYDNRGELMKGLQDAAIRNEDNNGVVIASGISDFELKRDVNVHNVFERADDDMYKNKQELKKLHKTGR